MPCFSRTGTRASASAAEPPRKDVGAQQLQGVDEVRYASWPKDLNESKRALVRTQMMKHGKMRCIDTGLLSLGEDAVTGLLRRLHYELGRAGADRGNPVFQRESGSDSHLMRWTPASDSPVVRVAKESSPTFLVDSVMRRFGVEDKVTNVVNQIVKQGRSPIPLNAELDALNARERLHVARRVNRVMFARSRGASCSASRLSTSSMLSGD